MRAMVLHRPGQLLRLEDIPCPEPADHQLLIRVTACGICRTDLHVVDGDLTEPRLPVVPGHQIVGRVEAAGRQAREHYPHLREGTRVGVPWLGGSCTRCRFCQQEQENLCDNALYTGYQIDGGFAEYTVADARYCFEMPAGYSDLQAAPLLCAGLIGYRSYRPVKDVEHLGLYGFGAAAHILIQVARHRGQKVYAFTREGDTAAQAFARQHGAEWAGDSTHPPPHTLDAAIIFAPVGPLVPASLAQVRKGGKVICAGIHMSDIPSFPYKLLWGERSVQSVANLTRHDGKEFLPLAARVPVLTEVHRYPLEAANEALDDLRNGRFTGAAVIEP